MPNVVNSKLITDNSLFPLKVGLGGKAFQGSYQGVSVFWLANTYTYMVQEPPVAYRLDQYAFVLQVALYFLGRASCHLAQQKGRG